VSAQLTCDFKQKQCNSNGVSEDLEKLRCELIALNKIRIYTKRQYVKEVISSDINLLAVQIEYLKDDVSNGENIWDTMVRGHCW
jgi:hypothetical protein